MGTIYIRNKNGIPIPIPNSDGNPCFVVNDTAPEDTSVLWVDPADDSDDGFQDAVNTALAQAKASGEFDGPKGDSGVAVVGAKVGQTVKIAEVDENGVPTAWEAVDISSEEEYELINTITIEQSVSVLSVNEYPDGGAYNLEKAAVIVSFPLMSEQYTTGAMEINFMVNGKRAYGAYGSSFNVGVHDTRFFQMSAEAVIDGGLIVGRNNMSMTGQLEHTARNNGPIISKVGENKISNVSVYVANGIPVGTTIEIYGVRA